MGSSALRVWTWKRSRSTQPTVINTCHSGTVEAIKTIWCRLPLDQRGRKWHLNSLKTWGHLQHTDISKITKNNGKRERPSPYLCVGAPLALALAAGEQVGLRASGGGHLVFSHRLFGQVLPHFPQFVTGHFLKIQMDKRFPTGDSRTLSFTFWILGSAKMGVLYLARHNENDHYKVFP